MFRGDARHTGVYETEGVEQLGGVRWRFSTNGPVRSSPVVVGSAVYVGSSDGHLYVLDRTTGSELWNVNVGSPVNSSPAVARGIVIFGSRDGTFYAFDARSGRERWRFETGDLIPWEWGFEGWDAYTSSPVVADTLVLFGAGDGFLYAAELTSGRELWRFETEGRIRSSPETEGASLVSAEFGFDRKSIIASPAVVDGTVYAGSRDGHMYAFDQETGERRWRADHRLSWAMSSPAALDGVLYSGTSDQLFVHALNVDSGEEIWRFVAGGYTWSSPALVGGTLYIGDGGGHLRALDRETGEERWTYRVGGGVLSSPVVADGVVYFGSDDGSVYALHGEGGFPHLAVFWDDDLRDFTYYQSHASTRAYFMEHGATAC
jgi:outer membrane protein assembly factor BamB